MLENLNFSGLGTLSSMATREPSTTRSLMARSRAGDSLGIQQQVQWQTGDSSQLPNLGNAENLIGRSGLKKTQGSVLFFSWVRFFIGKLMKIGDLVSLAGFRYFRLDSRPAAKPKDPTCSDRC